MRLYDVWETSGELYLILEYIEGGELFDYICEKGRLPEDEALNYFQQLISAIDYCHHFNIAHRDLKPENLLLDTNKRLKVADFGMAAWQGGGSNLLETACGSPHYAAPEVVRGEPYDGSSADIWSCGVILYALLAGRLPFDDEDIVKLLDKVKLAKFTMPVDIEPGAKDIISRMLERDASKRIKMSEILGHPWYKSRPPSVTPIEPPTLEMLSQPVSSSASEIDPDILSNLRTLWVGASNEEIVAGLVSVERTWEKAVYRLLMDYRKKCMEEWEAEEETRREKELKRQQRRKKRAYEQVVSNESKEYQVTRPSPPIPRRAASHRHTEPVKATGRTRAKTIVAATGPPSLPPPPVINPLRPVRTLPTPDMPTVRVVQSASPTPFLTPSLFSPNSSLSPITNSGVTPMQTPASPLWDALSSLALPPINIDADIPELQDENVQKFFKQIIERMNGMNGEGTHNTNETASPVSGQVALGLGINIGENTEPETPTAPLNISSKAEKDRGKENGTKVRMRSIFRRPSAKSSPKEGGRTALSERRVQILLPTKEKDSCIDEASEDPSSETRSTSTGTPSATSSSNNPSAGRRSWFANLFKPRSNITHRLTSTHGGLTASSALDAVELILLGIGAKVGLVEVEGVEMLKCELEEKKDPAGVMETIRAVTFRAEVRLVPKSSDGETQLEGKDRVGGIDVVLTYERGSVAAFRLICRRAEREWKLSEPESEDPALDGTNDLVGEVKNPGVGENGRFVEGITASVVCGY